LRTSEMGVSPIVDEAGFFFNVPCVCDDYVVEGGVLLAEAGEPDS